MFKKRFYQNFLNTLKLRIFVVDKSNALMRKIPNQGKLDLKKKSVCGLRIKLTQQAAVNKRQMWKNKGFIAGFIVWVDVF